MEAYKGQKRLNGMLTSYECEIDSFFAMLINDLKKELESFLFDNGDNLDRLLQVNEELQVQ